MTGLPTSDGSTSTSTAAKKASMSTWRMAGPVGTLPSMGEVCQHERPEGGKDVLVHRNVRAVVEAGRALGVDVHPHEYADGTRTAADAALSIGVDLGQIVKSLVFCVDGEVVIALVCGDHRSVEATMP